MSINATISGLSGHFYLNKPRFSKQPLNQALEGRGRKVENNTQQFLLPFNFAVRLLLTNPFRFLVLL